MRCAPSSANYSTKVTRTIRAALADLGFADEAGLAAAIRAGELDGRTGPDVTACLRTLVRHRLAVAHPGYDSGRGASHHDALPHVPQCESQSSTSGRQLFTAIENSDMAAVDRLWSDDIAVWRVGAHRDNDKARAHCVSSTGSSQTTTERRYQILDRQLFDNGSIRGFVQQHILHATGHAGQSISLRVCIVIKVGTDGLISRIDEYFDPAGIAPLLD